MHRLMKTLSTQEERDAVNPPPHTGLYETDPYLNDDLVIYRLKNALLQHGKLIVAFDFDDTVFDFHTRGSEYPKLLSLLKRCKKLGFVLLLYTSRTGDELAESLRWLEQRDLLPDYVNENVPGIPHTGGKHYYNVFLDDKAGLKSAYDALHEVVAWAESRQKNEEESDHEQAVK